jgi:hypothetical protein
MFKSRQFPLLASFIFILIIAGCVSALFVLWWFSHSSYDLLVQKITQTLNRPDLTILINNKIFPIEKYRVVYRFHWLLYILVIAITALVLYQRKKIKRKVGIVVNYIFHAAASVLRFYTSFSRTRLLWLVIGCLVYLSVSLYLAAIKPIIYDEAWGYQYYLKMPFYFSFLLFNTYPLNNFISHFFTYLPFSELINIRLPSILFGLFTILLFFYTVCKRVGFHWSVLAVVLLISSPVFSTYSYLARGVSLALLFTVIAFHFLLLLIENGFEARNRWLFVLANILGTLAMPTFILFTAASAAILVANRWSRKMSVKKPLIDAGLIGMVSVVFYFPMLLSSGSATVFHNNRYQVNFADIYRETLTFFSGMSDLFFGNNYLLFISLFIGFIHILSRIQIGRYYFATITSLVVVLLVILLRLLLGNILPERSLAFLIIPTVLLVILCLRWITDNAGKLAKLGIGFFVLLYGAFVYYQTQHQFLAGEEDRQAKVISEILLRNDITNIYLQEADFWTRLPMIEFYYSEKQAKINVHTSLSSSARYKAFDTRYQYDCIVQEGDPIPEISNAYQPIYKSKEFTVWKRKDN